MADKCVICDIVQARIPSKKIYEDEEVIAVLDYNGANPGHSFIIPKDHFPILEQVPANLVGKIFNVANKVSSAIFDTLKVEGTNIFVANGIPAGQKVAHFMVSVIPRKEGDGLNLNWQPRQLSEEEMSTIELKMKEEIGSIGLPQEPKPAQQEVKHIFSEENYLAKQLRRIP
ncbi:MAG TPA: HIT domain-containing protein [Candidatus Nanoarchaeia archaeon]|nr:HIT domain-containing protein [Candidatus Nanoarchaeia archaeon]